MKNINGFKKKKEQAELISMVTAYDYPTAKLVNDSEIDAILVGDSVAMVMHGFENTTFATVEMMEMHTAAVARGAKDKFIVTDMPFLSIHRGDQYLFETLDRFMKAGAHSVKIEGGAEAFESVSKSIKAGIPVMGHLGLTPQNVNQLGGYKVQGRLEKEAEKMVSEALELEKRGIFALILECVPPLLATHIKEQLSIPVIGIGAGKEVDGQILVIDDLLGKSNTSYPKFVRQYCDLYQTSLDSLNTFHSDVLKGEFPSGEESYQ